MSANCRALYDVLEVGIESDAPKELMKECPSLVIASYPSQVFALLRDIRRSSCPAWQEWIIWLSPVSPYQNPKLNGLWARDLNSIPK